MLRATRRDQRRPLRTRRRRTKPKQTVKPRELTQMTNDERLDQMVSQSTPTSRNPQGRKVELLIATYPDGHTSFTYTGTPEINVQGTTDEQTLENFRQLLVKLRA